MRTNRNLILGLAFAALFALSGCAAMSPAARDSRAADEAAIRKADADWARTGRERNISGWLAFYTDDAISMPPGQKRADTKAAIAKSVANLLAIPGMTMDWTPSRVEVARSGDLAYSTGTYTAKYRNARGKTVTEIGKYTEVWRKQPDGTWKCALDIWNPDKP